ncbi:carboxypeptidase-like regulatory domain-containing protein [Hymenobacter sp. HDW8]|uniref:carboxypeptidase-like regulatory domain-containing protein n=1 Tax=Hymenobacter sp. HDW8 TaxID=2714932 RepID=UPI00140BC5B1|nr:carboxypeptidase-like regulatory domain-containing protein [Hymenobacter sp. HDW8]QIL76404.1 carboxypeptidase-like regulatory domain-containing protein [Hymenobacter sp. HDW8]
MSHRPTITIPKPCHEGWTQMTPAAQGRHCAACDKVVVDFTRMTDAEVVQWLQHRPSGSTCGRFATQQLNRPLVVAPITHAPRWQQWVAATVAVVGLQAATAPEVQAQRPISTQQHVITMGMVAVPRRVEPLSLKPLPLVVRGMILDSTTQEPMPGATVLIAGTNVGVSTNADGQFELILPDEFRELKAVKLIFSSIGYINREYSIDLKSSAALVIKLAPDTVLLGEIAMTGGYYVAPWYTPRGLWQRAILPFRHH